MSAADRNNSSGAAEKPNAWSAVLLLPVTIPLVVVGLLILIVVGYPAMVVRQVLLRRSARRLRTRLADLGRFMARVEVEARLAAGEGTLIVEYFGPKGPIRYWWTPDDVIASAPVPLPTSHGSPLPEEQEKQWQDYALECRRRYLDVDAGTALLTQCLRDRYPGKSVLIALAPWEFGIFAGDYESVLFSE